MQIFLLGGHASPDVTLRFVHIQNLSGLFCQGGIDLHQAIGYVLMYCALAYSKILSRLPDCGIAFDDIVGNADRALLDIILQRNTPQESFLHLMRD